MAFYSRQKAESYKVSPGCCHKKNRQLYCARSSDGNYHAGWLSDYSWADAGGGGGGGGGGSHGGFWNAFLSFAQEGSYSFSSVRNKYGAEGIRASWWTNGSTSNGFLTEVVGQNKFFASESGLSQNISTISSYTPGTNWAGKWDNLNGQIGIEGSMAGAVSSAVYGTLDGIWTFGSSLKNGWRNTRNMKGEDLISTYGAKTAEMSRLGSFATVMSLSLSAIGGEAGAVVNEIKMGANAAEEGVFIVTREGVVLPRGAKIPSNLVENQFRSSSYGIGTGRNFVEELRIDPPRFAEPSHFHVNDQGNKLTIWRWF